MQEEAACKRSFGKAAGRKTDNFHGLNPHHSVRQMNPVRVVTDFTDQEGSGSGLSPDFCNRFSVNPRTVRRNTIEHRFVLDQHKLEFP